MHTLTIRGVDPELSKRLKDLAAKNKESVNQSVLNLLKAFVGLDNTPIFKTYDDLDQLAGGWTLRDEQEFCKGVSGFRKIDRDMWP